MTLLPLLVHVTMVAAADCCLRHASSVGLCFLLAPSLGALAPHGQGWVLSPPPFRSAAPKTAYVVGRSAQNSQTEPLSPIWAQPAGPCWALILLETLPFARVSSPHPGFAVQEGAVRDRFASAHQSNARTASVQGKWPPGFLQAAAQRRKTSPPAGGDGSCNTGGHRGAAGPKDHRDMHPTLSS